MATTAPDRQAELDALRRILLADERSSIETLRQALAVLDDRVGSDDRFRNSMTRELVAAFRAAEAAQHRELAEALSPLVLAGIRREIVESRDLMVEALYPITGRLVTTAVARAFQGLVADVNARLEAAVSPSNWRRRLKSLLTGRPLAEIILSETAGFRLERILLIDRTTGALLATWAAREDEAQPDGQAALLGGLLSAIVSFSRDAFQGNGHDLRALDLGDRVVMLRSSARRIVAAVGHGVADEQLEARVDAAFLSFLEASAEADDAVTSQARLLAPLASALAPQAAPARRTGAPVALLIMVALLVAALGYWGLRAFEARQAERRLDAVLLALGDRVKAGGGALALARDARAGTVTAIGLLPSETARRDLQEVVARELPGYRLEGQIVTATGGPTSLDATMGLDAQLKRLERAVASLRSETDQRLQSAQQATERLVASQAEQLTASLDAETRILRDERAFLTLTLPSYAVFFQQETEYRAPADAERDLDAVATLLKGKPASRIRLIGYGDAIGSRAANLKIALARARKVAADLIARGVGQSRLVLAARDDTQEIVQGQGPGNPNRRVTFEPAFIGE
jgi:outer membrane protein OmpA-like peptidoglycan-associated protein